MGSLLGTPKPRLPSAPAVAAPSQAPEPSAPPAPDEEELARKRRMEALARRQRGRAALIATSRRGVLQPSGTIAQRKSLLGE